MNAEDSSGWKLKRTRQCKKCPWIKCTDPSEIPFGYSEAKHRDLVSTIASEGVYAPDAPAMACHEHPEGDEAHCVGWLMNQLGPGNNIALRLRALSCYNLDNVQLDGPQHETFKDTLPNSN